MKFKISALQETVKEYVLGVTIHLGEGLGALFLVLIHVCLNGVCKDDYRCQSMEKAKHSLLGQVINKLMLRISDQKNRESIRFRKAAS